MSIDTVREALIKLRSYAVGMDCDYQEPCTPGDEDACQSCKHVDIANQALADLAVLSTIDPEAIKREAGQAAYDHAAVFHRRLVAAQDALVAYPAIVTKLVRGYGVDVNEHQIESWLNDQLAAILGAEPAKGKE